MPLSAKVNGLGWRDREARLEARAMRIIAALLFLLLLATFAPPGLYRPAPLPPRTILTFEPVDLDAGALEGKAVGSLLLLAGWSIRSNDPRFGGISAIHVGPDGVTAVSDAGSLLRFPLPGQTGEARVQPLPAGPGSDRTKSDRDAEAMVVHGGRAWVGFERSNAIWRYGRSDWRTETWSAPRAMRKWRGNRGSEAMVRLPGGRFLVFSEGGGGDSPVVLFDGDPAIHGTSAKTLRYRPPPGFRITDAALLPHGRLIFLNRRVSLFGGLEAKLTVAPLSEMAAGALIEGSEIALLRSPLPVDNMEALSVGREQGRTILWIASDDNFNPVLQRTLLLKFALRD